MIFALYFFITWAHAKIPYWSGPYPNPDLPAAGLPSVPGTYQDIYYANHTYGTYNHGPMIIFHDGLYYVSWYNSPQNESEYMRTVYATSTDTKSWSAPMQMFFNHSRLGLENEPWVVLNGHLYGLASSGTYITHFTAIMRRVDGSKLGARFWLGDQAPPGYGHLGYPTYKQMDDQTRQDAELYLSHLVNTNVPRERHVDRVNERSLYIIPASFDKSKTEFELALLLRDEDQSLREWNSMCTVSKSLFTGVFQPEAKMGYCRPGTGFYFNTLPNGMPVSLTSKSMHNFGNTVGINCTWNKPVKTTIPDTRTRTCVSYFPLRHKSQWVVYLLGSQMTKSGDRDPLTISTSIDGYEFTMKQQWSVRHHAPPIRYPGRAKSPGFEYPSAMWMGDNLLVVYSINKEDIGISTIPLSFFA